MTVVGARPQFIKAATVSRALLACPDMTEILVHTGQHFDRNMSDVFFDEMEIQRPDHYLGVSGGCHGQMTGRMLERIETLLKNERPDSVMVYGDTNSTLAGALAAAKLHIPVAHVESGLRSFNRRMPEEINRVLTDHVSRWLFCPTEQAVHNLRAEGLEKEGVEIAQVGDVMQDAALYYRDRARSPAELPDEFLTKGFALATVHRAENTDDPRRLREIVEALNSLHTRVPVVLPLHPRTARCIRAERLRLDVCKLGPVSYLEMIWLLEHCLLVLTDSGGLQKEAWFFHKPCVTLRDETEWVELITTGTNRLAGADTSSILDLADAALSVKGDFSAELYGGGQAAACIVKHMLNVSATWTGL